MSALIEVNTDGLAKLAETVGGWFGWNARAIEQNAEAEAYAAVRKVDAENAATLIRLQGEEQVANYMLAREKRKMNNVQNVVEQAQQHFVEGEQVSDEPVNQDWVNRFFTIVEDVSDSEMQKLWAQILAGEIKRPKSYSLRTLELLRNISKEEAEAIKEASKYVIDELYLCADLFGADVDIHSKMDELGIICGEQMLFIYFTNPYDSRDINIGNTYYLRVYSDKQVKVNVKCYYLTKAGREIFSLAKGDNLEFALGLAKHFDREDISKVELFEIIKYNGTKYTLTTENILLHHQYHDEDELSPVKSFMKS
jgi:hypothetical protein